MTDTLAVKTSGEIIMGEEQAKYFAISIYAGVKTYLKEHQAEFEAWLQEQRTVNK